MSGSSQTADAEATLQQSEIAETVRQILVNSGDSAAIPGNYHEWEQIRNLTSHIDNSRRAFLMPHTDDRPDACEPIISNHQAAWAYESFDDPAGYSSPLDAMDYYGYGKPTVAAFNASYGEPADAPFVFGEGPAALDMGERSDGVPVRPMTSPLFDQRTGP